MDKSKDGRIVDEWMNSKNYRNFQSFHPYLTYSNVQNTFFIRPNGKSCGELSTDSEALFNIGREAFNLLAQVNSKEEFNAATSRYFDFIESKRIDLTALFIGGVLEARNEAGDLVTPDWFEVDDSQIITIAWQLFSKEIQPDDEEKAAVRNACLWHSLREIDNAIIALELHSDGAVIAAVEASNALANALAIDSGDERLQEARREIAMRGANAKHAKTYEIRKQVVEYWREFIPYDTPIEKAAEWLKDSFPNIAHRTLCRYVSEAKKETKT